MNVTDIIEIIGICITLIIGACSIYIALKSNKISKEAISISKESNDIASKSLKISQDVQNEQKENVEISSYSNIEILKQSPLIQYKGNPCWDDYLLIIRVEIKNKSTRPVSVKRPFFCFGKDGEYMYVADDDFYYIEGYNQYLSFPCYLKEKETKHVDIIIGISSSDRLNFYANKGITLSFEGTNGNYKKYFSSTSVIDNSED